MVCTRLGGGTQLNCSRVYEVRIRGGVGYPHPSLSDKNASIHCSSFCCRKVVEELLVLIKRVSNETSDTSDKNSTVSVRR